jgi:hypothetical protein
LNEGIIAYLLLSKYSFNIYWAVCSSYTRHH